MAQFTRRDYDERLSLHYRAWTWALDDALESVLFDVMLARIAHQIEELLADACQKLGVSAREASVSVAAFAAAYRGIGDKFEELLN